MIDCIVPAHNEASTIGEVVHVLGASGVFRRVIVVDDGSKDDTAQIAAQAGANVLRLSPNGGKGAAMLAGVQAADANAHGEFADAFAFIDADLLGFKVEHVHLLAQHFSLGFDMVCGLRDSEQGPSVAGIRYPNPISAIVMPLLTGERFMKRWVIEEIDSSCFAGYKIETAMNYVVDHRGGKTCLVLMDGVIGKQKQAKVGFFEGWRGQVRMYRQIAQARAALEASGGVTCKLKG